MQGILLTWREIMHQNKKLSAISLIKFMVDSQIITKLVSLEILVDQMRKIMPSNNPTEQLFYLGDTISGIYKKEVQKISQKGPIPGDPQCSFWQFQFLLLKIAYEQLSKEQIQEFQKDPSVLVSIMTNFLQLYENTEFKQDQVYNPLISNPFQVYQTQMNNVLI